MFYTLSVTAKWELEIKTSCSNVNITPNWLYNLRDARGGAEHSQYVAIKEEQTRPELGIQRNEKI